MPTPSFAALSVAVLVASLVVPTAHAAELSYYLPRDTVYDPAIPTPAAWLGFEVGDRHVRHDQLAAYLEELARRSDRLTFSTTGKTYERRPLVLLTISSPANLERLEEIRRRHLELADPTAAIPDLGSMPAMVYLGYSVHGNEASGANAALVVAYHLAAATGDAVDRLLESSVILLDPALNPDGLSRFTQWVTSYGSEVPNADPQHREHRESWPRGRTNHYGFDLNRDWLLAQHPETRARLELFHRFRPNLLLDFHEMDRDSTFFFQPGVPSRQNPLIPERNLELTRAFARYHARALDALGSLYYTRETFDDFYLGKGSTYPDVHGSVGILFEQASVGGQVVETEYGSTLSFAFAIRNHVQASLSSLAAAADHRVELLDYQARFAREPVATGDVRAYVFGADDPSRLFHLLEILRQHQITVHALARPFATGSYDYRPGAAYVVPLTQPQWRLVQALFTTELDFADNVFYDVSTWTLPLAFGVEHAGLTQAFRPELLGEVVGAPRFPSGDFTADPTSYAYVFDWQPYYAPRALYRLLAAGAQVRIATRPLTVATDDGRHDFPAGAVVVPLGTQTLPRETLEQLLGTIAAEDAVTVHSLSTGLNFDGLDLGSPLLRPLAPPRPALLVGDGVAVSEAGEVWHLLDQRFAMPLTLLELGDVERADLGRYTHLILVDGEYRRLEGEKPVAKLRRFVTEGGTLVASQQAALWVSRHLLGTGEDDETPPESEPTFDAATTSTAPAAAGTSGRRPYADFEADRAAQLLSGAIFEVELDLTHPLAFGYASSRLPVFRSSALVLPPETNPYTTVAQYSNAPLLSGYASPVNRERLRNTPALVADRLEKGLVVRIADDLNFRAFWYGTNKLFLNTLFLSSLVEPTKP